MISSEFKNNFLKRITRIDSINVTATQCIEKDPNTINGTATIFFENEILKIVFYPTNDELDFFYPPYEIGAIIKKEYYYKITFSDKNGKLWETDRFLPKRTISLPKNEVIWNCSIRSIKTIFSMQDVGAAKKLNYLTISVKNNLEIPINDYYCQKCLTDNFTFTDNNVGIWHIREENENFKIMNLNGSTIIKFETNDLFPQKTIASLLGTISFMWGEKIEYEYIEYLYDDKKSIELFNSPNADNNKLNTPLVMKTHEHKDNYDKLFYKYFKFIDNEANKLIYIQNQIIASNKTILEVYSLVLSTCIENLIKNRFDMKDKKTITEVDSIITLVRKKNIEEKIKNRILGSLNSIRKSPKRAKDILNELLNNGVITKEQKKSWDKLRNSTAHGSYDFEVSDLLKLTNDVLTLYYLIIFEIIGYKGEYVNYSKKNFPVELNYANDE